MHRHLSLLTIINNELHVIVSYFCIFQKVITDKPLTQAPPIRSIDKIILPEVISRSGSHKIDIYEIIKPYCEVVKLELVFLAGRPFEKKKLTSTCCAALLREGTITKNSDQISEQLDYYGASLNINSSLDTINFQIVCLKKYFSEVLAIAEDVLINPTFPLKELDILIKRRIERLKIDAAKNDIASYRKLTENIFGPNHPYGYNSKKELYESINRDDIINHQRSCLSKDNCTVFMAGDIDDSIRFRLDSFLVCIPDYPEKTEKKILFEPSEEKILKLDGSTTQTSIKLGRKLFSRNHRDYHALMFVNTLLGGFFGSRLVSNVREDKGLTYNIYSLIDTHLFDGSFIISTDVTPSRVNQTLKEIYNEMDRLCQEPVKEEELNLVKNYLSGTFINFFDGPFNSIRAIKSLVLNDIPISELKSLLDISRTISSDQIIEVSQRYLDRNDFCEVVVG